MVNYTLILLLTIVLIVIRAYWIYEEVTEYKERAGWPTIKTNIVEFVILVAQIVSAIYFPWPQNKILTEIGIGMFVIGILLAVWAKFTMRQSWGPPAKHNIKKQRELITTGPYSFSRNPIYVGFALIYLGYAIAIRSWLIILRIPLLLYFYKSAKAEEKNLPKYFGKKYLEYKKRVPRFLFV